MTSQTNMDSSMATELLRVTLGPEGVQSKALRMEHAWKEIDMPNQTPPVFNLLASIEGWSVTTDVFIGWLDNNWVLVDGEGERGPYDLEACDSPIDKWIHILTNKKLAELESTPEKSTV